jgi:hypothetical protein
MEPPLKRQKINKTQTAQISSNHVVHSDERPYECDQCKASFKSSSNLTTHKLVHSNERPYKCDRCNASFKTNSALTNHKKIHSDERPYKCDQCKACFKQKGKLTDHKKIHSDVRPFKCDQCDSSFKTSSNLTDHQLTHSTERTFQCDECSACFKTNSTLINHKKSHNDNRPFECNECKIKFKKQNHLDVHIHDIHKQERNHACQDPTCAATYKRKEQMLLHFKSMHTPEGQQRQKKEERKIEMALQSAGLYFDREVTINFQCLDSTVPRKCARIDFVHETDQTVFALECDEHQHDYESVQCEIARMSRVYENYSVTRGEKPKPMCFIRFNPHAFKIDKETQRITKKARYARLVDILKTYNSEKPFEILYMYYDANRNETGCLVPDVCNDADYHVVFQKCAKYIE